jgi:SRSO17 transposase
MKLRLDPMNELVIQSTIISLSMKHRVLPCHLIACRDASTSEIKFSLSNAPQNTSLLTLAKIQAQRYWIERAFHDLKSACGIKDYPVQGWLAWHHQIAMVILSQLFMMELRIENRREHPNLICMDVEYLLTRMLPRKP